MKNNRPNIGLLLKVSFFPWINRLFPSLAKKICIDLFLSPFRLKSREEAYAVMNQAEEAVLEVNHRKIQTYSWGTERPYILLVHGWSGRGSQFYGMIEVLRQAGFTVRTMDAIAHGRSDGEVSGVIEFELGIAAMMAQYGQPKVLIGHSLGSISCMYHQTINKGSLPLILISMPVSADQVFENFATKLRISAAQVKQWLNDYCLATYGLKFHTVTGQHIVKELTTRPMLICHDTEDREASFSYLELLNPWVDHAEKLILSGHGHTGILGAEALQQAVVDFVRKVK